MSSLDIVSRHRYIKGDLIVGDTFLFRLAAVRAACGCNGFSPSAFAVQPNNYLSFSSSIDGTENLGIHSGSLRL